MINVVQAADKIPGWMEISELEWLASTAAKRNVIVELGSWKGRSTKALAASTSGVVFAIDTWGGSPNQGQEEAAQCGPDAMLAIFRENLKPEIDAKKAIPIRAGSIDAVPRLKELLQGRPVDMVFIDADHRYECVKRDIEIYMPLLRSGGILCGHDYHPGWPGVIQAVHELVPSFKRGPGMIWYYDFP